MPRLSRPLQAYRAPCTGCALSYLAPECNSFGLALMTDAPLEAALRSNARAAIVLENDLYRRLPARTSTRSSRHASTWLVLDSLGNARPPREPNCSSPPPHSPKRRHARQQRRPRADDSIRVFPPDENGPGELAMAGRLAESRSRGRAICAAAIPELAGIVQAAPPADISHGRSENPPRTPPLQRAHCGARQHRRERAEAAR